MVQRRHADDDVYLTDADEAPQQLVREQSGLRHTRLRGARQAVEPRCYSHRSLNQKKPYGLSVSMYGSSPIRGNRLWPNISIGIAPASGRRSSSATCAVPDRLVTTRTVSPSNDRTYARTR